MRETDEAQAGFINKQARLEKLRYGKRKPRNLPWKGASNVSIPMTDSIIRRLRPAFASLILDADPVATFRAQEASDIDPAREVEPFFDWLFKTHMNTTRELMRLIDIYLARGHAYVREGWNYETEKNVRIVHVADLFGDLEAFLENARVKAEEAGQPFSPEDAVMRHLEEQYRVSRAIPQEAQMLTAAALKILEGEEYVRITYRRILHDKPAWQALDPIDMIVPADQSVENADFVVAIHRMNTDKITRMARDGHFDREAAARLLARIVRRDQDETQFHDGRRATSGRELIVNTRDAIAGISRQSRKVKKPEALIYEIHAFLDIDGNGEAERVVLWHAPMENIRLATYEYAMPFDEWPFTPFLFSQDAGRALDQRGVPEMVLPLAKLVNAFHNAWVDAATIQLAPAVKARSTNGKLPSGLKWAPGAFLPSTDPNNDYVPVVHDLRVLGELLRGENVNQTHAENYVGIFDASIRNTTQRNERRTATEVAAIQNVSDSVFGLDSKLFQESMSKSFGKIWKLWMEFGPPEIFVRVEGRENPLVVQKHEIDLDYDIRASGTPANTQRAILLRNIEQILPVAVQDPSGRVDLGELFKQYFRLIEFPLAEKIVRSPEEGAAAQAVLQAAAQVGSDATAI